MFIEDQTKRKIINLDLVKEITIDGPYTFIINGNQWIMFADESEIAAFSDEESAHNALLKIQKFANLSKLKPKAQANQKVLFSLSPER